MKKLFSSQAICSQTGLTILRIVLGALFLAAGIMKLADMQMVTAYFGSLGLSSLVAWLVTIGEIIAGAALLLGIATRIASAIIIIIMAGASVIMIKTTGFMSAQPVLFYGIAAITIFLSGPGSCTLAHKVSGCASHCDTCKDSACCSKQ